MKKLFLTTAILVTVLAAHGQIEIGGFYMRPTDNFSQHSYQHTGGAQMQMLFRMAPKRTYLGGSFQFANLYGKRSDFEGDVTLRDGRYNTVWPLKLRAHNRLSYYEIGVVGRHYFVEDARWTPFLEGFVGLGFLSTGTTFTNRSRRDGSDQRFSDYQFETIQHQTGYALSTRLGFGFKYQVNNGVHINVVAQYLSTTATSFYGKDFLSDVEIVVAKSVVGEFDPNNRDHINAVGPEHARLIRSTLLAFQLAIAVGFQLN